MKIISSLLLLVSLLVSGCGQNSDAGVRYSVAKPAAAKISKSAEPAPLPVNPLTPTTVVTPVAPTSTAPTLTLPLSVTGETGEPIEVVADTNCDAVQWYVVDPGLRQFQTHKLLNDKVKSAIVWAHVPGSYRLLGYAGNASGITRPVITTVVITSTPLVPVVPTPVVPIPPQPGPTVVDPPVPAPVVTDARVPLKNLFVVTIDDWSKRGANSWLANASALNSVRSQVKEMAVADKTSPEATLYAKFVSQVSGGNVMLIMDSTTKPWTVLNKSELALPTSSTAAAALLAKYGK
jgi:hypothetical protein